jgi:hypothetical protein
VKDSNKAATKNDPAMIDLATHFSLIRDLLRISWLSRDNFTRVDQLFGRSAS